MLIIVQLEFYFNYCHCSKILFVSLITWSLHVAIRALDVVAAKVQFSQLWHISVHCVVHCALCTVLYTDALFPRHFLLYCCVLAECPLSCVLSWSLNCVLSCAIFNWALNTNIVNCNIVQTYTLTLLYTEHPLWYCVLKQGFLQFPKQFSRFSVTLYSVHTVHLSEGLCRILQLVSNCMQLCPTGVQLYATVCSCVLLVCKPH